MDWLREDMMNENLMERLKALMPDTDEPEYIRLGKAIYNVALLLKEFRKPIPIVEMIVEMDNAHVYHFCQPLKNELNAIKQAWEDGTSKHYKGMDMNGIDDVIWDRVQQEYPDYLKLFEKTLTLVDELEGS